MWKEIAEEVHKDADRLFKMIAEAYAMLSDGTKVLIHVKSDHPLPDSSFYTFRNHMQLSCTIFIHEDSWTTRKKFTKLIVGLLSFSWTDSAFHELDVFIYFDYFTLLQTRAFSKPNTTWTGLSSARKKLWSYIIRIELEYHIRLDFLWTLSIWTQFE